MTRLTITRVSPRATGSLRREVNPSSSAPPAQRPVSLDALRGFTMFWIVGGQELVFALVSCIQPAWLESFQKQMRHPPWQGFVAWDLIMPVFLFVVGAAMPFAIVQRVEQGVALQQIYWRIARRFVALWLLGIVAQGCVFSYDLRQLELFSNTLQAIAVGYVVTALALLHLSVRGQVGLLVTLVVGYAVLLTWVPFGGHPAGTLEQTVNFARHVDEMVLGRFRRDNDYTWIVTSLGFSASVLLGAMAGHLLHLRLEVGRKLLALLGIGTACVAAGWVWSYWLPLNRHLWTSSMILWAGGISFFLLALFYGVIDVAGVKRWSFFFVVIGSNALLAYLYEHVFDTTISDVLVINLAKKLPTAYGDLVQAVAGLAVLWLILLYLYRQRTFFKA